MRSQKLAACVPGIEFLIDGVHTEGDFYNQKLPMQCSSATIWILSVIVNLVSEENPSPAILTSPSLKFPGDCEPEFSNEQ
ncbi:unnamed protein product [Ceratitis capitata]|uniref:(Mediterranean fruit fly) hypothetical protein n=1 Tax=Ceratitis capitata TaxID=7213 RepID=A0A811VJ41_CERCA|nr:unnamed protein product [Ceratitis capitata]